MTSLFFSSRSCVYAYSHDGTYLYTLEFRDISNGNIYIRCEGERLYIKLRNNNVLVFQGRILIDAMNEDEADTLGFSNDWFFGGSALAAEKDVLYFLDNQQNRIPVAVPSQILLPQDRVFIDEKTDGLIVLAVAVLVFGFCGYHIFKKP